MPDDQVRASPYESSLQVAQAAIWAVVFMCTWLAVVGLLPGPTFELADELSDRGATVVASDVRRHIDTGRGLYVAEVEVTFLADGRSVTTHLQHVTDVGDTAAGEDVIVPRDGLEWGDGPYEWWEEADQIPPGSRYAPPLRLRFVPDHPEQAMAQADLDALEAAKPNHPAWALAFAPLAIALLVPQVRRLASRRRSAE
ncbi:hypothetical protein ICW40_14260 [Actinotalea ferrariae]|uniref:hypothetical protein n=1 Tax=Actinotalea ferrariae TaxID=1386098 RepID=UPI001C8C5E8B|nr:hypothetical protein [Actinotalea ferrariae]MBX9245968.1 hypothetical protein [Actinotalea ferrariae]